MHATFPAPWYDTLISDFIYCKTDLPTQPVYHVYMTHVVASLIQLVYLWLQVETQMRRPTNHYQECQKLQVILGNLYQIVYPATKGLTINHLGGAWCGFSRTIFFVRFILFIYFLFIYLFIYFFFGLPPLLFFLDTLCSLFFFLHVSERILFFICTMPPPR